MCLLLILRLPPDWWAGPTLRPREGQKTAPVQPVAEPYTELPSGPKSPCPDSSRQPTHLALPLSLLPRPDSGGPRRCLTCCLWDNIGLQLWGEKRDKRRWSVQKKVKEIPHHSTSIEAKETEKTPGTIPFLLLPALCRRRQPKQLSFLPAASKRTQGWEETALVS